MVKRHLYLGLTGMALKLARLLNIHSQIMIPKGAMTQLAKATEMSPWHVASALSLHANPRSLGCTILGSGAVGILRGPQKKGVRFMREVWVRDIFLTVK